MAQPFLGKWSGNTVFCFVLFFGWGEGPEFSLWICFLYEKGQNPHSLSQNQQCDDQIKDPLVLNWPRLTALGPVLCSSPPTGCTLSSFLPNSYRLRYLFLRRSRVSLSYTVFSSATNIIMFHQLCWERASLIHCYFTWILSMFMKIYIFIKSIHLSILYQFLLLLVQQVTINLVA